MLRKVSQALGESGAQPMLVGAFARDVWFWIETGRATQDIDLSMAFPGWSDFRAFAATLKTVGFDQPDPFLFRLICRTPNTPPTSGYSRGLEHKLLTSLK